MCRNCVCKYGDMGNLGILTLRLATLIVLHAAGAGFAYPTVLVTRPMSRVIEWLPTDNQTIYTLGEGEVKSLELNTTSISRSHVHITISPCTKDVYWGLYRGPSSSSKGQLTLLNEYAGLETFTYTLSTSKTDKYLLQLSSKNGGGVAVSVRGETSRLVRMRLRIKSRRRLSANWDPSPIDPQETTYCVVASHQRNYTSLCAAQYDLKTSRLQKPNHFKSNAENTNAERLKPIPDNGTIGFAKVDNAEITNIDSYRIFEGDYNNIYRRKKFSRSTKVTDKDPVIACVGERTHHLIENLDPSTTYYVSVFGVARDRPAGTLLASGRVRPRTSAAKRLRENVPYKADVKGKVTYYFKATVGPGGGLWLGVTTCGGAIDVEVLVRGKRLFLAKDIDPQQKLFVPAPIFSSSVQETSDEGSVQFDSSSEEARMRYVIKIVPSRWDRESGVNVEIVASTSRWGINSPEISQDAATVRELRPRRSCKSVDIAFLPASHRATDVIRYCVVAYDLSSEENFCTSRKTSRTQCANRTHKPPVKVITQKINGLKSGRKYAIHVTASIKGNTVPYNVLYVDTNASCKN